MLGQGCEGVEKNIKLVNGVVNEILPRGYR